MHEANKQMAAFRYLQLLVSFLLFNTLKNYNDSVKVNLSFKDLCHFMNVSLLAVLLFFISSLNH